MDVLNLLMKKMTLPRKPLKILD